MKSEICLIIALAGIFMAVEAGPQNSDKGDQRVNYHSSASYNASYNAGKAVAGSSKYYCSPRFGTADCRGVHWWIEFKRRPATIVSISFQEGKHKKGGEFQFWGCNGAFINNRCTGEYHSFAHGTAEELSSTGAFENHESYNIYGLSSIKCPEYELANGDFYWSISNFKFEEDFAGMFTYVSTPAKNAAAEAECVKQGGHLAILDNDAKLEYVKEHVMPQNQRVWLGADCVGCSVVSEDKWQWKSGSKLGLDHPLWAKNYGSYKKDLPYDSTGNDAVHLTMQCDGDCEFINHAPWKKFPYICEKSS